MSKEYTNSGFTKVKHSDIYIYLILFFLLPIIYTTMTIWYISATGSDTTGSGSAGSPYATVEKCITLGSNGDTIKALTGTYTITSTTNITKQVTITSITSNKTDVIFSGNCTIFNVQSSDVVISYLTLQTSSGSLVNLDVLGNGSAVPVFYTGFNINNCNIKYNSSALILNGTFSVSSNAFTRLTGSSVCDVIKVHSSRGGCSISSNTFTDSGPIRYVLYFTSDSSNAGYVYYDYYYSKGGTMNISGSTVTYTHASQSTTFMYFDYFNQYAYTDFNYNLNTKLSLTVSNNNLTLTTLGKFIILMINGNSNLSTFGKCTINVNTVNNTDYGTLHLGKNVNSTTLTIPDSDLIRSIFKIYSNTLTTPPNPLELWIDASDNSTMLDLSGNPCTNNTPIVTVKNKGLAYNFTQFNTGVNARPVYKTTGFNSKPTINFNAATGSQALTNATYRISSQYFTIVIVYNQVTWASSILNLAGDLVDYYNFLPSYDAASIYIPNGGDWWQPVFTPAPTASDLLNRKNILIYVSGTTMMSYYVVNDVKNLSATTARGGNFTFGPMQIGHRLLNGNSYMTGDISEIRIYNYAFDATGVTDMINTMKTKWSL
jgi:hypothetical protein